MKRILEFVAAFVVLVLTAPLLLLLALVVRVKLGSPVIFRQDRPGLGGEPFTLYKFRTMTADRGANGELLSDERRLTGLGRFLRRTSLDELPELINVLRGDMSFVGPRPLLVEYLPLYSGEQVRRHEVRPGITGWAQVSGRNTLSWDEKFRLDVWYVDNRSFRLDLKILAMTIAKVFRWEQISREGRARVKRFKGNVSAS